MISLYNTQEFKLDYIPASLLLLGLPVIAFYQSYQHYLPQAVLLSVIYILIWKFLGYSKLPVAQ